MKWNDIELIDGKFYFIEVERWRNGEPNHWVFAYKDNNDLITNHHVYAKITDTDSGVCSIYYFGHVCCNTNIISLRPATRDDMNCFWDYLDRWGYKYNINTKKIRHVGDR